MPVVELRALSRDDFPLLGTWLREPAVARWWHDDPALDALERRYGPSIDGSDPTRVLIGVTEGEPVGLIQWYRLQDEPEYRAELAAAVTVPEGAVSLDYLIGAADRRGHGLGRAMIGAALRQVWTAGASAVLVPVQEGNAASRRVLERSGFRPVATAELEPDNPAHDRRHVIYRMDAGDLVRHARGRQLPGVCSGSAATSATGPS